MIKIPRIVIAGTQSGVGKTTLVTGLLAALKRQGLKVQSYKVGPDYIDPGYHMLASGCPAHNLDTWLVPPEKILPIFSESAAGCDLAVIEGVMGLYDGGRNGISSTAAIAKLLQAPVVLVVNAKSMGQSIAALALGFQKYDPEVSIAGVIANRLGSDTHAEIVQTALEEVGLDVLGLIRRQAELQAPERHLGLTPVEETDAAKFVAAMSTAVESQVDVKKLQEIAAAAPLLPEAKFFDRIQEVAKVKIGVAMDPAFSFYYPASLKALERLGAEIVYFSPLDDSKVPEVDGILLGGGFPEMFLERLAANKSMLQSLRLANQQKMPILAECGGLMYLTKQIVDFQGNAFEMTGLVPAVCRMEPSLQTVGYVTATLLNDSIIGTSGSQIKGHEFHFSRLIPQDEFKDRWAFSFKKTRSGQEYIGGFASENLVASYLHFHFAGEESAAKQFIASCRAFSRKKGEEQ